MKHTNCTAQNVHLYCHSSRQSPVSQATPLSSTTGCGFKSFGELHLETGVSTCPRSRRNVQSKISQFGLDENTIRGMIDVV